jgi:uroporphyrin-III C-methyltransferase
MNGKVYLVGAGPGDPELLTLKALRLLRQADAVLHDDLVSPQILTLVPRKAQLHDVGKRAGQKSTHQQAIHFLMIELARQGLQVVRLKGGDPLIFGRAGEEIQALRKAGLDFEVVPGVTSAFAAAASAEIPLTLRQTASSLLLMTGHFADDRPLPDLHSVIKSGATIALYMPGSDPRETVQRLVAAGVPRQTPCALVSRASTAAQQMTVTTLEKFPAARAQAKPSLLILGDVVRHSNLSLLDLQALSAGLLPAQATVPPKAEASDGHKEASHV